MEPVPAVHLAPAPGRTTPRTALHRTRRPEAGVGIARRRLVLGERIVAEHVAVEAVPDLLDRPPPAELRGPVVAGDDVVHERPHVPVLARVSRSPTGRRRPRRRSDGWTPAHGRAAPEDRAPSLSPPSASFADAKNRRPGAGGSPRQHRSVHEDPRTAVDRRRATTRAPTCAPAPGSRRFDSKPYAGKCSASSRHHRVAGDLGDARRRRHRQRRGVALDHRRAARAEPEVVVVAVEDHPVGLVALRGELGQRPLTGPAQRRGHAERVALLVGRVPDRRRPPPTAAPSRPRPHARPGVSIFESSTPRRCAGRRDHRRHRHRPGPGAPSHLVDAATTTCSPACQQRRSSRRVGAWQSAAGR